MRRKPLPPSWTSARAKSWMAAVTTTPPSRAEKGGTSVQPPARSSRTGAAAAKVSPLTSHPPVVNRRQLAAEIHGNPVYPAVGALETARVIQKGHRQRIGEHALSCHPVLRHPEAGQGSERS